MTTGLLLAYQVVSTAIGPLTQLGGEPAASATSTIWTQSLLLAMEEFNPITSSQVEFNDASVAVCHHAGLAVVPVRYRQISLCETRGCADVFKGSNAKRNNQIKDAGARRFIFKQKTAYEI